jgi:hypothetical protein
LTSSLDGTTLIYIIHKNVYYITHFYECFLLVIGVPVTTRKARSMHPNNKGSKHQKNKISSKEENFLVPPHYDIDEVNEDDGSEDAKDGSITNLDPLPSTAKMVYDLLRKAFFTLLPSRG